MKMGPNHTRARSLTSSSSTDTISEQEASVGVALAGDKPILAPIVSSYNEHIRPLLDAIDRLRELRVMEEGIHVPTIVVVGDQSSGKSSVLESLAGISLPRGQGICTRVPLIMRLQHHSVPQPELSLEFAGHVVPTDEDHVSEAINEATERIAGHGKGISNNPITLVVKKMGVPDLTMVDLPGITRVPVHGQPEDIYEQIRDIIMKYIKPEESIILNVLSATVDFTTCESIRMSRSVDKTRKRTLAVVTKADMAPEGLLEKVTADDVNIGLGYVCVRNRVGNESYEEARMEEATLFQTHPLLSKIDKSIVGIPVLAERLMQIQASRIDRNLPGIVKKINDRLNSNVSELNKLPKNISSAVEAMTALMRILRLVQESLRKVLLRGEFDEFPDDKRMHCTARLVEMLDQFSNQLHNCAESDPTREFLMEEIWILEETKQIALPNFLPHTAFLAILQRKVKAISGMPIEFVGKLWNYIEEVVMKVLMHHVENYDQLQLSTRRAATNMITEMKERSISWMTEVLEMEKVTDYTCNPEYVAEWNKLMSQCDYFIAQISNNKKSPSDFDYFIPQISNNKKSPQPTEINLIGVGDIDVGVLINQSMQNLNQGFDLRMRMIAYWRIVLRRLVDGMALHLQLSVKNLVNRDLENKIVNELFGKHNVGGIERLMELKPAVASKRGKLNRSIIKLTECKDVLASIMDRIVS